MRYVESLSKYIRNLLASLFLKMQSIFGGRESLTSDLTICMKSRECNNRSARWDISGTRYQNIIHSVHGTKNPHHTNC